MIEGSLSLSDYLAGLLVVIQDAKEKLPESVESIKRVKENISSWAETKNLHASQIHLQFDLTISSVDLAILHLESAERNASKLRESALKKEMVGE